MAIDFLNSNSTYNNPYPNLIVEKNVVSNCKDITLNCQLTYTITLNNVSSVNLESVSVIEDIIYGLRYELNSLRINGISPIGGDINLNKEAIIPIGSVRANSQIKIVFRVTIDEVPVQYPIANYVRVLYKYYDKNRVVQQIQTSNNVSNNFTLPRNESGFVQYVDGDNIATKGLSDDIEFKIVIQPFNTIEDCFLSDYLNEALDFVSAEVIYNNTFKKALYENSKGLSLGTITNQDKVEIIINAKLKDTLDEIPSSHFINKPILKCSLEKNKVPYSYFANPVYIYIKAAYIKSYTTVDKNNVNIGDDILFSIDLKNLGTTPVENVIINNILPSSLQYINDSATILYNGLVKCSIDYNLGNNSLEIPIIDIGEEVIISVNAKVLPPTSKSNNKITNNIFLNYSYLKYPNENDYSEQYELVTNQPILKNTKKCINSADLLSTLNKKTTSTCECQCSSIDYVISFTNTGDLPACNVCIEDFLENAYFDVGSLKVLTNRHPNPKPYCGNFPEITIKEVCPDETITIYFSATIDKNSHTKEVKNYAKLYYQYFKCDCNYPIYVEGRTNTVITPIEEEKITSNLTIQGETSYQAQVGDEVLYKITLKNTSLYPLFDVIYTLNLSTGYEKYLKYKPNSLKITGGTPPTLDINPNTTPIKIGTINPGETVTIQFMEITLAPTNTPIISTANGQYSYQTNPLSHPITCFNDTNSASLTIVAPLATLNKQAYSYCPPNEVSCVVKPINSAGVGDRITYKVTINNTSSTTLDNVLFNDPIPSNMSYVQGSLKINGVSVPYDLSPNLQLKDIAPHSTVTVSFDVIIKSSPSNNIITNTACINYDYLVDTSTCNRQNGSACDSNNLVIQYADLTTITPTKVTDTPVASRTDPAKKFGNFTVTLTNSGNTDALNVKVTDTLPNGLTFTPGSVVVTGTDKFGNNVPLKVDSIPPGGPLNIENGIIIADIPPLVKVTIKYGYSVNSNAPDVINNIANFDYSYMSDGQLIVKPNNDTTKATIIVVDDVLDVTKTVSPTTICPNGTLLYTVNIDNLSKEPINNVVLVDTIPIGTTFVSSSFTVDLKPFTINGKPVTSDNLANGVNIGTISNGSSKVAQFQVNVNSTGFNNPIVNTAYVDYINATIPSKVYSSTAITTVPNNCQPPIPCQLVDLSKKAYNYCSPNNPSCVVSPVTTIGVGDRLTYVVTISNVSDINLTNVLFNDELPSSVSYVPNSLTINGVSVPSGLIPNLPVGTIPANKSDIVKFDVIVNTIPNPATITNNACTTYSYITNCPNCETVTNTDCTSNSINVVSADLISITPTKKSDAPVVSRTDPAKSFGNYIVTLTNSGNTDALNVKVTDTLPNGLTFIPNSVVVTGTDQHGNNVPLKVNSIPPGGPLNIENGIIIEDIPPLVTATIKYGYTVNSNAPNVINNIASFDYSYISNGQLVTKPNNNTTEDTILVVDDIVDVSKTVSPTTICPNGTLLYTVKVDNLSQQQINNVVLLDTIPNGTNLVPSSFTVDLKPFTINGKPVTSTDLSKGVNIGTISKASSKVAQFQVNVNSTGFSNPIVNTAYINYTNTTIPSKIYKSSVIVTIPNNCPPPPPQKYVDLAKDAYSYCPPNSTGCVVKPITSASVGDRITYEVTIDNISNTTLTNVLFNDTLPASVSYISNSLTVNGVTVPSGLIPNLPIAPIPPGDSDIVAFDVLVNSIPNPSTITNTACTTYTHLINCPNCETITSTDCISNNLLITSPELISSFKKSVNKVGQTQSFNSPGDFLTYIIDIENNGNIEALNTVFLDTLPDFVGYFAGTATVVPTIPSANITEPTSESEVLKIKFDTIPVGQSYQIEFVTGLSITITNATIINKAELDYSYISSSTGTLVNTTILSNTVVTRVNSADLVVTKAASASQVDINVPVTYTITVKNVGNIVANNIFVKDILPPFVKYIPNSLRVNGLPSSDDINAGILIGSLQPYNSAANSPIATITFQVVATTAPSLNPIINTASAQYTYVPDPTTGKEVNQLATSNQVRLTIIAADLISEPANKQSDTFIVTPGNPANDNGTYTTVLYNSGNTDALNVVFRDPLPNGIVFNPGTVVVTGTDKNGNNVPLKVDSIPPGGPLNIENGITIATIPPYVTVSIAFGYTAVQGAPSFIENTANFDYSYVVNNSTVVQPNNQTNTTTIVTNNNSLGVTKLVTPSTICPGQTLLYSVDIKNLISSPVNNVVLQDTLPAGTTLVPSSFTVNLKPFTINGNPVTNNNLAQGVNIGSITVSDHSTAQYLVTVNTTSVVNPIVNTANVTFTSGTIVSSKYSSTVSTTIANNCPSPCPPCPPCPTTCPHPIPCPLPCNRPCPHYGKSSCRPGRRQICKQNVDCYKECSSKIWK